MTRLKNKSNYELEEILDCLCSIKAKLNDYRHVIDESSKLSQEVQISINNIVDVLESRE